MVLHGKVPHGKIYRKGIFIIRQRDMVAYGKIDDTISLLYSTNQPQRSNYRFRSPTDRQDLSWLETA